MKLVGQIPRPLLGHMASRRGRSALGDEAWDNSSLAFFLSCSQAAEEIRDPGSNLQSASTHSSHLSLLSSFVVRSLFPYEEFSILFHIPCTTILSYSDSYLSLWAWHFVWERSRVPTQSLWIILSSDVGPQWESSNLTLFLVCTYVYTYTYIYLSLGNLMGSEEKGQVYKTRILGSTGHY